MRDDDDGRATVRGGAAPHHDVQPDGHRLRAAVDGVPPALFTDPGRLT
jgi:hypothetical protein